LAPWGWSSFPERRRSGSSSTATTDARSSGTLAVSTGTEPLLVAASGEARPPGSNPHPASYSPVEHVELPLPEFGGPVLSTVPDTSDKPGDSAQVLLAIDANPAPVRPVFALDTLVDLALVEPSRPPSSNSLELLGTLEGGVGGALPGALCLPQRSLPRPWFRVLLGNPGDAAAFRSVPPRRLFDPPVVRCPIPSVMSPAAAVEAAFAPPPAQIVEVTTSAEALPRVATGFEPPVSTAADPGPSLPTDHLLPSEDELHNIFTSYTDDSVAGPVQVPSSSAISGTRPTLHPLHSTPLHLQGGPLSHSAKAT